MLDRLPLEIVLNVLRFCGVRTLYNLQLLNREWAEFVRENESPIYRAAAIYHGFIEPSQSLSDLANIWVGVSCANRQTFKGWKDFCHRRFEVEYNWDGRGKSPIKALFEFTGRDIHRFKLDERRNRRLIFTTHRRGGLRVVCMDNDEVLFELEKRYVRPFAHCEYENGFLIFDRFHPHSLEIWRLSDEWDQSIPPSNILYRPDELQMQAPRQYLDPGTSAHTPGRGTLSPWALFTPTHSPRAYRFVYPTLLVGSEWGQELYLFNVPTTTLEETIPIPEAAIPPGANGVHITYVELGARHVFVCTPFGVLILPRNQPRGQNQQQNGDTEAVQFLDFPSTDPSLRIPQLVKHYSARMIQTFGPPSNREMREFIVTAPRDPEQSTALVHMGETRHKFTAVHTSLDGKDFVATTELGVVYLVRDFERVFRGEANFSEITVRINMGTPAYNLAFEHDRVAVQTAHGLFVLNLHSREPYEVITPHIHPGQLPPQPPIFPQLSAFQLLHFCNPLPLRLVSCVKMTRTAIWLDWSLRAVEEIEGRTITLSAPDEEDEEGEEEHPYETRMVCRINFAHQDEDQAPERRYLQ